MSKHQRRKLTIYYQVGEKRLKQSFRTVQELLDLDTDSHKHQPMTQRLPVWLGRGVHYLMRRIVWAK